MRARSRRGATALSSRRLSAISSSSSGLAENTGPALSPGELQARYDHVLETEIRLVRQMPDGMLDAQLPNRPRSYRTLMHHIFQIPTAFLDMEDAGATLTYQSLVVPPHAEMGSSAGSPTLASMCDSD